MVQIGNVPEIVEVKSLLTKLAQEGLVEEWELAYENLLTRLDAAVFFMTPVNESKIDSIWKRLETIPFLNYSTNVDKTLSLLQWRIQYSEKSPE